MLWPLNVVLVANTNGRLAIPALAGRLVLEEVDYTRELSQIKYAGSATVCHRDSRSCCC